MQTENRERTLAIVGGVDLEELLGRMLSEIFIEGRESEATLGRVLGTFHSRTQVAYCLGLISSDEYADLHTIRRIRNHFAHNSKGCSFGDQEVIDLCQNLRIPRQRPDLFEDLSPAEQFEATVFVLQQNLWDRMIAAKQRRSAVPDEIDSRRWQEFF